MSDAATRLVACFAAVFPEEAPQALPALVAEDCEAWDSLATVTLAALIEEEFDVVIEAEAAPHFSSFASIARFLETTTS